MPRTLERRDRIRGVAGPQGVRARPAPAPRASRRPVSAPEQPAPAFFPTHPHCERTRDSVTDRPTVEAPSAELVQLARSYGVATEYWDWLGEHVTVSASTVRTVLGALGVDASTD